jgi:O-antigen/teichoic acid export membrane protein
MAMSGFGYWSLVILYLSRSSMKSLLYMVLEDKWKPRIYWSFSLFNRHIVYGFKITSSTLIGTSTNNLLPILISNYFGLSFLGYYSQGNSLARIIYTNVNAGINKVFFAFFSNRDEKSDIKISKYLIVLSVVSFFVVISSLCFGEKLILMLYGKKWSDSIFIFIKLTIGLSLLPTVTYMLSFLNTNGFENYVLKLNLIRRSMLLLIVFFGAIFLKFEDFISLFSFAFYLDNVLVISSCLIKIKVESLVVLSEFSMLVNTALLLVIGVCSAYLLNIFIESTPYRIIVTLLMFLLFCYFNYQRFESLNKME